MATLGRYELRDRLGRGGFATVYRAWDPRLRREVALKALSVDWSEEPDVRRRFMAEAQALAGLHHPNIVTIFDVEETPERPFFTMELIEGQTLADLLAGGRRLGLAEAVALLVPLADAIDMLHTVRLVHRDIKAANIMVEHRGRVVLMDLGIARQLEGPQYTSKSVVMLSPESAAPEQVRGQAIGPATDIYALGVVTYQMMAGRPPFLGDTAALLHAHVYEPPPPLWELRPDLPGPVYAVVQEALSKDPARRPAQASVLAAALRDASGLSAGPLPAPPAPAPAGEVEARWGDTRPLADVAPGTVPPPPAGETLAAPPAGGSGADSSRMTLPAPAVPGATIEGPLPPAGQTRGSESQGPIPTPYPQRRPGGDASRRRVLVGGAGVVAVGLAAGTGYLLTRDAKSPSLGSVSTSTPGTATTSATPNPSGTTAPPVTGTAVRSATPAATATAAVERPMRGGALNTALNFYPTNVDPIRSTQDSERLLLDLLTSSLFEVGAGPTIVPGLVESWQAGEPGSWVLKLRQGVTFQDGAPLNADAVKLNIERAQNDAGSFFKTDVQSISKVEAIDPLTVRITQATPNTGLLSRLTSGAGQIISPAAIQQGGSLLNVKSAGSGAFTLTEAVRDTRIVLSRSPSYWRNGSDGQRLPYLDRLTFNVITDTAARIAALRAGQVDFYISNPGYLDLDLVKSSSDVSITETDGLALNTIVLNTSRDQLKDARVRQALSLALDREAIKATIFAGTGKVVDGHIPPALTWAYDQSNHPYLKWDIARAKQLLTAAGYSGNLKLTLTYSRFEGGDAMAQLVQEYFKQAGVAVELQVLEFPVALQRLQNGDFDAMLLNRSGSIEPDDVLYPQFSSKGNQNYSKFSSPELDAALERGRTTLDGQQRADAYRQAQKLLSDQQPVIVYYNPPRLLTTRTNVRAYPATLNGVWGAKDYALMWRAG
jgi:peptide/nickel transport system substrate-binding protein